MDSVVCTLWGGCALLARLVIFLGKIYWRDGAPDLKTIYIGCTFEYLSGIIFGIPKKMPDMCQGGKYFKGLSPFHFHLAMNVNWIAGKKRFGKSKDKNLTLPNLWFWREKKSVRFFNSHRRKLLPLMKLWKVGRPSRQNSWLVQKVLWPGRETRLPETLAGEELRSHRLTFHWRDLLIKQGKHHQLRGEVVLPPLQGDGGNLLISSLARVSAEGTLGVPWELNELYI